MSAYTLYRGRPDETSNPPASQRLAKELRTYDFLDGLGITYDRVDHPAAMTMEACLEIDGALNCPMCKNIFLCNRQQTDFYLLMMPGDKPFRTKDLSAQLGVARLSFAPAEQMEQFLDIPPGSLSVLGLMNDREGRVRLLIDESLLSAESMGCHPCINTSSLRISTADFLERIIPALRHQPTTVRL